MLKFSLRDLFWLTVVAAFLCGWWLQYRRSETLRIQLAVEKENRKAELARAVVAEELARTTAARVARAMAATEELRAVSAYEMEKLSRQMRLEAAKRELLERQLSDVQGTHKPTEEAPSRSPVSRASPAPRL